MVQQDEEQVRLAIEGARKQLESKTWPEVMAVFQYRNPKALRTSDEDFAELIAFYKKSVYPNMAACIEIVQFQEKRLGIPMSFNLSLRRRDVPGEVTDPTTKDVLAFMIVPDILVGTRRGIEGAFVWFKNFSEVVSKAPPEVVQVMEKIMGEAVAMLHGPSHETTLGEMIQAAVSGTGDLLKPPKTPKKH